jgi:hypothetical protein
MLESPAHEYELLHSIAQPGHLVGKQAFHTIDRTKTHDWYREGARLLIQKQQDNGWWKSRWTIAEENPIVATRFSVWM